MSEPLLVEPLSATSEPSHKFWLLPAGYSTRLTSIYSWISPDFPGFSGNFKLKQLVLNINNFP